MEDKSVLQNPAADKQNLGDMVNLVDIRGNIVSTATKLDAHLGEGQLHLAFSVFLFTKSSNKVVLQKRASNKYHFPGKWANACCSHPRPGEEVVEAAQRRLGEELGLNTSLQEIGNFIYRARCEQSSFVEYEFDHVIMGVVSEEDLLELNPSRTEIEDLVVVEPESLLKGEIFSVERSLVLKKEYQISYSDIAPWVLPALLVCEKRINIHSA